MSAKRVKIVKNLLKDMPDLDKDLVLVWSQSAKDIVDKDGLTKREKLTKLKGLETSSVVLKFIKQAARVTKAQLWDNRSLPGRMAIGGLAVGLAAAGNGAAGLAAFGTAVGIKTYLLTSAGGALLGTIIDEIKKSKKD